MIKKFKNLLFVFILMFLFIFIGSTNNIAACNDPNATNYDETYVTPCAYGTQSRIDSSGGGLENPIGTKSFTELLKRIIGYLIVIGAPILALMVLYGGFYILTAGGNPEKFKTGKDVILYAVIGYIIILVSWGIIYIIGEILGAPDLVNKIK